MILLRLARQLIFWISIAAIVALLGWTVAQATDDNTPPYDEGAVSTVAWNLFLASSLVLLALGLVAGVRALHRAWTDRQ